MPRRQPKPEPITPEEVMDSPALRGLEILLQSRSPEELAHRRYDLPIHPAASEVIPSPQPPDSRGVTPMGEQAVGHSPIGEEPIAFSSLSATPISQSPTSVAPMAVLTMDATVAVFKPGPKIHRAVRAQDGHSVGEHAIYLALWNAANAESPDTRLIRIGYGGLQSLTNLDKTNCKDNIQSLIRKLAVEIVSPFSVARNEGNTYRIFSERAILKRRQLAGMEWVVRNKGVRFVENPNAARF